MEFYCMASTEEKEYIHTNIWMEKAESDNPFAAAKCYCAGYDVYGDLLGKIHWPEYLYLLVKQERPTSIQSKLLEDLAIVLANPGPRDHSVRAAMTASVGGATSASCLMAALAVGAGQYGGAREVYLIVENWNQDIEIWKNNIKNKIYKNDVDIWPDIEHVPGFDPYGVSCTTPVKQTLLHLSKVYSSGALGWLVKNRSCLEAFAGCPLSMASVAAAVLIDLEMNAQQAEMLYLLLRLPGAAAHANEQYMQWKKYPFFKNGLILTDDPSFT